MTLDVREGDLVKATHRDAPDLVVTGRVKSTPGALVNWVYIPFIGNLYEKQWDFEVLERAVDQDLLDLARNIYRKTRLGLSPMDFHPGDKSYLEAAAPIIELLQSYHNKKGTNA